MQITVLALNPSIDLEWRVRQVRWEEKNVVESERRWPGGKGVNVARWIAHLGGEPLLLVTSGGTTGRQMESELRREGLRLRVVRLREPTFHILLVLVLAPRSLRFDYENEERQRGRFACRFLSWLFAPRCGMSVYPRS
jgi:sugar/nucleoside kinase (ribokinase family)